MLVDATLKTDNRGMKPLYCFTVFEGWTFSSRCVGILGDYACHWCSPSFILTDKSLSTGMFYSTITMGCLSTQSFQLVDLSLLLSTSPTKLSRIF